MDFSQFPSIVSEFDLFEFFEEMNYQDMINYGIVGIMRLGDHHRVYEPLKIFFEDDESRMKFLQEKCIEDHQEIK